MRSSRSPSPRPITARCDVWALHTVPGGLDRPRFDVERANLGEILAGRLQDHPDIAVRVRLVPGDPAEQIVRLSTAAGLVVVGEPHRFGGRSWAHSVARTVLDRTYCPLAIVPRLSSDPVNGAEGRGRRSSPERTG